MDVDGIEHEEEWYIPWMADLAPVEAMLPPEGSLHAWKDTSQRIQLEDRPSAADDYADAINDLYMLLSSQK